MGSEKAELKEMEKRLAIADAGGGRRGKSVKVAKGYKLPVISPGDMMHSMVITVKNTALCIGKLQRE